MSEKKKQKLPKWFNGELYTEGATVVNPFTGENFELTNVELSIYDFIIGLPHSNGALLSDKIIKDFDRALTWFRVNNPAAYMVLLD